MPVGTDLGLPPSISPDFLQPLLRLTFPEMAEPQLQGWMCRFADCGIYTTQQLLHACKTRATSKVVPAGAHWRGRPFVVNELIGTYSGEYLCQLGVFYPPFFDRYGPFFRVLVPVS